MDKLIDLLQDIIPEIEDLKEPKDLLILQSQVLSLVKKIDRHSHARYRKETQSLLSISETIRTIVEKDKKKISSIGFTKTKSKVLSILNEVLEMED